jgi:polysaccharide export outer membrane protein
MIMFRAVSIWRLLTPVALVLLWGGSANSLDAQSPPDLDPGRTVRSRADLEDLLQYYEDALLSPAYSDEVKASLNIEASRIRERLTRGDFKLGDRIVLFVQGEPNLPDTVPVQPGPMISLPLFGEISLEGVLRSEVEDHVTEALSVFLRDPVVRAEGLVRVSVQGAVARPGFYLVPADVLLSETIMVAGGPTQDANLESLRVERGIEVLFEGEELQEALRQGLSLDQMNMQAGDQLVVPQSTGGFWTRAGVIVGLVASVTLIVVQLSR